MRIFLSSTYQDLEPHRTAVTEALGADGHDVVRMEDFGAQSIETWQLCAARLACCDVVVLLLGKRYGSLMPGEGISYTHAEYVEPYSSI